jgi:hypothetical protein
MQKDFTELVSCTYPPFEAATDAALMRSRLEERLKKSWGPNFTLAELWVPRVFARGDGGYSIQYAADVTGHVIFGSGQMFLCGYLPAPGQKPPDNAQHEHTIYIDDLGLIVSLFPFDSGLPQLPRFFSKEQAKEILAPAVTKTQPGVNFAIESFATLGYRLERRCVIRYDLKTISHRCGLSRKFQLIVKILRSQASRKIIKSHEFLAANGFGRDSEDGLILPRMLSVDSQNNAVIMESVSGRSPHDLLGNPGYPESCHAAGKILAKLHSLNGGDLPVYGPDQELETLRNRISSVEGLFPSLKAEFNEIYELLRDKSPDNVFSACIHRDYYDKQIVYSRERVALLDCDNLATGDPALDYGNFLAHLMLRERQEPRKRDEIGHGRGNFITAYGYCDMGFAARARWWQATALTRLATLYLLRPRWRYLTRDLLLDANRVLKQSG